MLTLLPVLASAVAAVPDSGVTGLLLGGALIAVGLIARALRGRKG
jgi:hypothetical protein